MFGTELLANTRVKTFERYPMRSSVFCELLDPSHGNDPRYVTITRWKIFSELEETVFRNFDREINDRMADYLKDHQDPENVHLREIIREYYPC